MFVLHNAKLINLWETAVSLYCFFALLVNFGAPQGGGGCPFATLRGHPPPPCGNLSPPPSKEGTYLLQDCTSILKVGPFQIIIFSALRHNKNIDLPSKVRLEEITKLLESIRPNLKFELTIVKCSSDKFHDRTIITNNYYIGCGGGFDLFKSRRSQKTTTVNIVTPYLNHSIKWATKAYSNLVSESSSVYRESPEFMGDSFPNFHIGVNKNRLLESMVVRR